MSAAASAAPSDFGLSSRFECEKLVLVGDPRQLPPTIQGSDAAHENGLEQTLFDRLCLMVLLLNPTGGPLLPVRCAGR